ncbi:PucR family transcriptional regulator [Microbacterium paraoxydans]|uniref:PucR family transcriptional regulator n=1 Tax=Microbacterium paraoxydans TaxID=199592 RepID=UPI0013B3877B|nr:helix-turn-helix domain-containing protein [Microbacterium paraoxydans]
MTADNAPSTAALFDSKSYTRVQDTLDHVRDLFDCQVYIEDSDGKLLYSSDAGVPDGWRSDFAPFSTPSHANAKALLEKWFARTQIYRVQKVVLVPGETRILLPLAYQGKVFAIVHYVAHEGTGLLEHFLDREFAKALSDKIYIVVIGSINITRKRYLPTESVNGLVEVLQERGEHRGRIYQIGYVDFGPADPHQFTSSIVDYASIAMRHTKLIAKRFIARYEQPPRLFLLHRREDLLQTVIVFVHDSIDNPAPLEAVVGADAGALTEVPLGLSPMFTDVEEMRDRIEQAQRILDSGRQLQDDKIVFSQADGGFDALVWQLTRTKQARALSEAALKPLGRHPELMRTLETYLANDGNVTKTAEILVVDRRTVTYRLERISYLLGHPMASIETRVLLFLALKAQKRL